MATHRVADRMSETERPTSTAARHMGSVRNRSMTPVVRSVLKPTAVPMADVVRFSSQESGQGEVLVAAPGDRVSPNRRCR